MVREITNETIGEFRVSRIPGTLYPVTPQIGISIDIPADPGFDLGGSRNPERGFPLKACGNDTPCQIASASRGPLPRKDGRGISPLAFAKRGLRFGGAGLLRRRRVAMTVLLDALSLLLQDLEEVLGFF